MVTPKDVMKEQVRRKLARESMYAYMQYSFDDFITSWHISLICKKLDDWIAGRIKRLMIFIPPRHGKSLIVSERLPTFIIGNNPSAKIIAASYSQDLVNKFSRSCRFWMEDNRYKVLFPKVLIQGRNSTLEWETSEGGVYKCSGVGGGITGRGFEYGIIDDPIKNRKEAESKNIRDSIFDWYSSTFYTRQSPDSRILIIQTRWHQDDLSGRLIKNANLSDSMDNWEVISLPAILNRPPIEGDPRKKGEALCPVRYPIELLNKFRMNIGAYDWESLYQQNPISPESQKFRRSWFNIIDREPSGLFWSRFWDLAVSSKNGCDYTVGISGAYDEFGNLYLKNMIRGQWEWPEVRKNIKRAALYEKIPVGIEKVGTQQGFIDDLLCDSELINISIKGYSVDGDKLTRSLPFVARAEAGKVYLITGSWINDFLDECESFTGCGDAHDDIVDSVSGVLKMLGAPPTGLSIDDIVKVSKSNYITGYDPNLDTVRDNLDVHINSTERLN